MIWTLPQRLAALAGMIALALAVGFGAGYHYKSLATQAAVVKQATAAVKQAGTNIVQSAQQSQKIEASIEQSGTTIDQLNKAAQARLQKGNFHEQHIGTGCEPVHADGPGHDTAAAEERLGSPVEGDAGAGAGGTLDLGTVRLLNRARD